ncbi:DUF485 domain-containing protein [Methylophaga frappieri]
MDAEMYQKIHDDPRFQQLVTQRARWVWSLSAIILVLYFSFILLIAFMPGWLAQPIEADTVMTIGIPLGVVIIVSAFVLTGIYVHMANTRFDALTQAILQDLS